MIQLFFPLHQMSSSGMEVYYSTNYDSLQSFQFIDGYLFYLDLLKK